MKKLLLGFMLLLFGMYALPSNAKTGHFVLNFDCSNVAYNEVFRIVNYKTKVATVNSISYPFTSDASFIFIDGVHAGGESGSGFDGLQFGSSTATSNLNYNYVIFTKAFAGIDTVKVTVRSSKEDSKSQFFAGYTTNNKDLTRFYLKANVTVASPLTTTQTEYPFYVANNGNVTGSLMFKMYAQDKSTYLRIQKIDVKCEVVDIPAYRYAASTSSSAIDYPASGLTPFSVNIKDGKAVLTPVSGIVAANSPVLVFGKKDTDKKAYTYPLVASLSDAGTVVTSDMKVSDGTIQGDGSTIFELGENSSGEVGFKRVDNGTTVADGTGYVVVTDATSDFIPLANSASTDVSSVGYATYYDSEHQLAVPAGATAYTYKVSDNTLIKSKTYTTGSVIPKATGVVIESDQGTVLLPYADEATAATDADNMLKGSDTETTTSGGGKYYMLSLNSSSEAGSVGFYYGTDEGAAFTTGAHKAYLVVPSTVSLSAKGWAFKDQSNQTPTSIAISKTIVYDGATYNLAGQRVDSSYRGIVIRNGKKYINR